MSKESKYQRSKFRFQVTPFSIALLCMILLLGVALRFYNIGNKSYWSDEMYTVIESQQSFHQILTSGRLDQPPAYYFPLHFWIQAFGATEASTRAFSALTGIASIALVFLIGRDLFGSSVGLLAAFLMSVAELQVDYSQTTRYYIFFEFTTLLSFLFFVMALRRKRAFHFVLYWLASVIMIYSNVFGLFVLAAQDFYLILQFKQHRDEIPRWLLWQTLMLIPLAPYFYPLIFGAAGMEGAVTLNIGSLAPPTLMAPLRTVLHFILSARRDRSWGTMIANYSLAGILLVAGLVSFIVRRQKDGFLAAISEVVGDVKEARIVDNLFLSGCWLVVPVVFPFVISFLVSPIYQPYYAVSAAPALYLLLAFGIYSARRVLPMAFSLIAIAIMITPSLGNYYATDFHDQWKQAITYVEWNSSGDEVIVIAPNSYEEIQQRLFDWYYKGSLPSCGLDSELTDGSIISDDLMQCVSGHSRFWVIISASPEDPAFITYASFFLNPHQTTFHLLKQRQFVRISVYLFSLAR